MPLVTLYGKPGCCLCDEARATILAEQATRGFELREVDISVDPALDRRYGERIPVVAIDGTEVFELHVDPEALASRLDRLAA
ncbi:MAG: glutaredoxin family protein [Actinomycetota bacterium]|nr:glutaredoxin family protein [Actinomycetota bacterium]